ncbi:hypothetical protein B0G75_114155 [Paraburkholderia sp. BL18I3N2]|uniref:hypothetical protein n=1 Tax=Paraburkholderia sp. BL18I3N2 TaxID=1938799 RepID=UPI000D0775C8|nr:hypothetical protein [Paraburkholderia sp. BL18I3N2]PRX27644.1 hypothetical protein B0G75_114155 [Paraburkholderia sp. BL18I3N2]
MMKESNGGHADAALDIAVFLLTYIIGTATLFALLQGIHAPAGLAGWAPILGAAVSTATAFSGSKARAVWVTVAALLTVVASMAAANIYFDFSSDGLGYHANAIHELADHFDFLKSSLEGRYAIYINNYPKISWFYTASLLKLTGNFEIGKSINFILMLASGLVTFSALRGHGVVPRSLAAICVALNPIAILQLFTHYVDGCMAAFLSIQILCIYGLLWNNGSRRLTIPLLLASIGAATLKDTGLVFSAVLLAGAFCISRIRKVPIGVGSSATATLLLTFAVLAVNPYVKNLVEGHHVFYPVMGAGRVENLISGQITPQFHSLNRFTQLGLSVMGKTRNENPFDLATPRFPQLKVPFTVDAVEFTTAGGVDVRWGGWGPLFGGALLLAIAAAVWSWRSTWRAAPLLAVVVVLCVISPESWWARLNPQLYVLVCLLTILALQEKRIIGYVLVAVLMINSGIGAYESSIMIRNAAGYLKQATNELSDDHRKVLYWSERYENLQPMFDHLNVNVKYIGPNGASQLDMWPCKQLLGEWVCARP